MAAQAAPSAMMFIKPECTALVAELTRLMAPTLEPRMPVDTRLSDFDGTHFRIEVLEDSLDDVRVSMAMPAYKQLEA